MADYTPTGKPDDVTRYDSRAVRREFELIAEAISTKAAVGASSTVSTTSMLIESPATKTFTAEPNKEFAPGQTVYIADAANPATNSMTGLLTSYDIDTGEMVVEVTAHDGSGTIANWVIGVSNAAGVTLGTNTFSGAQNFARATRASHPTNSLIWNAPANQINFTGTANITALPNAPQGGAERVLICADACSFTAGANILIDGVQSGGVLQCAANDIVLVRATSVSTFRLSITRYAGNNGGVAAPSSAVDVTLTSGSNKFQSITMTAAGKKVTLPSGLSMEASALPFIIKNAGWYRFNVFNGAGVFLCEVLPKGMAYLSCVDNTTTAGVWQISGDGVRRLYRGNSAEVINAVDSRNIAVAMLSPTKAICVFRNNATTFLNAVILNFGAASGTPIAVNAEASDGISLAALTSSQAVVAYRTSTGVTKGYVLGVVGDTITPGTVATIDGSTGTDGTSLEAISTTQLICAYFDGGSGPEERILTISASTISAALAVVADATAGANDNVRVATISATKALYAFRGNSPNDIVLRLQSITGTTPAPTGIALRLSTHFTDQQNSFNLTILSSSRALVTDWWGGSGGLDGYIIFILLDISDVTPVKINTKTLIVLNSAAVTPPSTVKLDANRAYVSWLGADNGGLNAAVVSVTSDADILIGAVTERLDTSIVPAEGYLACAALSSQNVINVYRNFSTYLTAKVVGVPDENN